MFSSCSIMTQRLLSRHGFANSVPTPFSRASAPWAPSYFTLTASFSTAESSSAYKEQPGMRTSSSANRWRLPELANVTHEIAAVTGACLAVSRTAFEAVGGLREEFEVAFSDLVFCLDLYTTGRRNIYVADCVLIHHESKTRGFDTTPEKVEVARKEALRSWLLHPGLLRDDPFYSPNLSLVPIPACVCAASTRALARVDQPFIKDHDAVIHPRARPWRFGGYRIAGSRTARARP